MVHRKHFAAALLLALASAACSRASAPPPPPDAPPATSSESAHTTSAGCADVDRADERGLMTCEAKEEFRSFVEARQACSSAAECSIVNGSCPFGCFVPVAKAAEAEVVEKLGELGDRLDKAGHRCVYRCMSPPEATCEAGRCAAKAP